LKQRKKIIFFSKAFFNPKRTRQFDNKVKKDFIEKNILIFFKIKNV
jgi:hypothetical protein